MPVSELNQHAVELEETQIMGAIREKIEDAIAKIVRHTLNVNNEAATSTITLKIKLTPEDNRQEFGVVVDCNTAFSAQKPFATRIIGGEGRDGRIVVNAVQPTLFLG